MDPVAQLEAEWQGLCQGPLRRAFPRWQSAQPALARFESPGGLLAFLQREQPAATDPPLLALLSLARGDPLAGRVCLQALLPALKALAARIVHPRERRAELWELLLGHAWEVISAYPAHRVRRVAANVVLDVLHATTRELRRAQLEAAPLRPELTADRSSPLPLAEGRLARALAGGVLGAAELELIALTRLDGVPLQQLALELGVAYPALLKRRQRAEARLRSALEREAAVRTEGLPILTSGEERRPAGEAARRRPDSVVVSDASAP